MLVKRLVTTFILCLPMTEAHSWVFVDTPPTLDDTPEKRGCRQVHINPYQFPLVDCTIPNIGRKFRTLVADDDGSNRGVETFNGAEVIVCQDGYCESLVDEEFRGRFSDNSDKGLLETLGVKLSYGYYFARDPSDGRAYAFQNGAGPLAEEFPRPWIVEEDGWPAQSSYQDDEILSEDAIEPTKQVKSQFDEQWGELFVLSCTPADPMCGDGVNEFTRDELPDYFPMADVSSENGPGYSCFQELCQVEDYTKAPYNKIGLNPFWSQWNE